MRAGRLVAEQLSTTGGRQVGIRGGCHVAMQLKVVTVDTQGCGVQVMLFPAGGLCVNAYGVLEQCGTWAFGGGTCYRAGEQLPQGGTRHG